MVAVALVAAALAALLTGAVVALLLQQRQRTATTEAVQQALVELQRQSVSDRDAAIRAAVDQVQLMAHERLDHQDAANRSVLDAKQQLIDQRLDEVRKDLKGELGRVSDLVAQLGNRNAESFGEVAARLRAHAESTDALAATTQSLRDALSNPKARGQWGERMAEDVLRLAGFVEHVNYEKQTAVAGGRAIPDYTFPLPKGQVLYMDVKFPLASYLKFLDAGTDAERSAHRDQFLRDVRMRVRELAAREYADRGRGSLDYVLLFLPNESIIGFVHEQAPVLVDEALRQKVVLCSPLTLFAMLGVIRQAYDNFMVEQTADEMLSMIGSFQQQYEKLSEAVDKVGRSLDATRKAYDDLAGTRRRQLEKPLQRLEELRQQRGISPDEGLLPTGDVVALSRVDAAG